MNNNISSVISSNSGAATSVNGHLNRSTQNSTTDDKPDVDTIKLFAGQVRLLFYSHKLLRTLLWDIGNYLLFSFQIPRSWNEDDCRKFFEKYGRVFTINILRDKATQVSRGWLFLFKNPPRNLEFRVT